MDWPFKRIFGSKGSEEILLCFLNDLPHSGKRVIQSLEIIDPYMPAKLKHMKNSVVDVRATLAGGEEVLMEMQLCPVKGFTQRLAFNGAKAIVAQLRRGQNYSKLCPVTVIAIADCNILLNRRHWLSHYTHPA